MKNFYIIVNKNKDNNRLVLDQVLTGLEKRGCTYRVSEGEFQRGKRFTSVSDVPENTENQQYTDYYAKCKNSGYG